MNWIKNWIIGMAFKQGLKPVLNYIYEKYQGWAGENPNYLNRILLRFIGAFKQAKKYDFKTALAFLSSAFKNESETTETNLDNLLANLIESMTEEMTELERTNLVTENVIDWLDEIANRTDTELDNKAIAIMREYLNSKNI